MDRQIAMTYVWVVRFDDRQKVRFRTRDPNRFSGVIDGAMPIGDYDCGLEDSGPLCMAFAYKQIATCGWGNCLLDAALARFASEARGRTALSSLPDPPHIPQMLATNA